MLKKRVNTTLKERLGGRIKKNLYTGNYMRYNLKKKRLKKGLNHEQQKAADALAEMIKKEQENNAFNVFKGL